MDFTCGTSLPFFFLVIGTPLTFFCLLVILSKMSLISLVTILLFLLGRGIYQALLLVE
jgi:hypothetical protein